MEMIQGVQTTIPGTVTILDLADPDLANRWTYFRIIDERIGPGYGKSSRMGHQIQLRSFDFRGELESTTQDVVVRWALMKTKTGRAQSYVNHPELFLSPPTVAGVPDDLNPALWNTTWISSSSEYDLPVFSAEPVNWRHHFKMLRTGRIHMPTYQLSRQFKISVNFRVGYRPIVDFAETSATGRPVKNEYILFLWCNLKPEFTDLQLTTLTQGAVIRNAMVKATWYDA